MIYRRAQPGTRRAEVLTLHHNRYLRVAVALDAMGDTETLEVLRRLSRRPCSTVELANQTGLSDGDCRDILSTLESGGVISRWAKDAWILTQLGGELWTQLRPVLDGR